MKATGLLPPLQEVVDMYQEDGAFYWRLQCGHCQRIGMKPARATHRNCYRCLIESVTQKAKDEETA